MMISQGCNFMSLFNNCLHFVRILLCHPTWCKKSSSNFSFRLKFLKILSTPLVIPYCPSDKVFGISLQVGSNCNQNNSAFRLIVIIALHFLFSGHCGLSNFIPYPPLLLNDFDTNQQSLYRLLPKHLLLM